MHGLALKGNSDQPRASEATPWVKYYKLMHGLALKGQQHIAQGKRSDTLGYVLLPLQGVHCRLRDNSGRALSAAPQQFKQA